jgi:hypothetical protein
MLNVCCGLCRLLDEQKQQKERVATIQKISVKVRQ